MKSDLVGTFHTGIWPDSDYGGDSNSDSAGPSETSPPQPRPSGTDSGTGCLLSAIPQVIAKADLGEPGLPTDPHLDSLPARVRKLVALRRKQLS